jgi:hypothetical protein
MVVLASGNCPSAGAVADRAFRRRAPARRGGARTAVATAAASDGRAALGARPRSQGRDTAVP